jgi:HEAT repeat protein
MQKLLLALLTFSLILPIAWAGPATALEEWQWKGRNVTVDALVAGLVDQEVEIRRLAARGLSELGPDAREAVPSIIKALSDKDDQVRAGAAAALGNGGPIAIEIPALIEALKDPAPPVQFSAVKAAGRMGPAAKALVPALIARMDNTANDLVARQRPDTTLDLFILKGAAEAIGSVGPEAKQAVPSLIEFISPGEGFFTTRPAIRALGQIGPAAKQAIPKLKEVLERAYPQNGTNAASLDLQDIAHGRIQAALALWQIDRLTTVIPRLEAIVEDKEARFGGNLFHVRESAAGSLGEIGPEAAATVPALAKLLEDDNDRVRVAAAFALGRMGPKAASAVPALAATLTSGKWSGETVEALGRIGPAARSAMPALIALSKKGYPGLTIGEAMWLVGGRADLAVPALVGALQADRAGAGPSTVIGGYREIVAGARMRKRAADALARMGPAAKPAVPALTVALADQFLTVREAAAEALKKIDPEAATKAGMK